MVIWFESKNPVLYSSGISTWVQTLLENLDCEERNNIVLVGPMVKRVKIFQQLDIARYELPWLISLPRKLNHIVYDNFTFQLFARIRNPELIFMPYFDVSWPRQVPGIITVHDLCFLEVAHVYPRLQVWYFTRALRRNIPRAKMILTVSETSKSQIVKHFDVQPEKIIVVPNLLNEEFEKYEPSEIEVFKRKKQFGDSTCLILYTSGIENRKNIPIFLKSLEQLISSDFEFKLLITGNAREKWEQLLTGKEELKSRLQFLGFLSPAELKTMYKVADVVVYPSLSEGLGMACLESMSAGTPLACSDIAVFREVANGYAEFFSPTNPVEMAGAIRRAHKSGPKKPSNKGIDSFWQGFNEFRKHINRNDVVS